MNLSEIRLGIAFPVTDEYVPTGFHHSFVAGNRNLPWMMLTPRGGGPIDLVRNDLADQAVRTECTHVWFVDTDQIYPQDVLPRLLAHDLDVVAAKVHRRYPPYDPILNRGKIGAFSPVPDDEWSKGGLVEVDSTGMGSVLVKTDVFKKIERPWFRWLRYPDEFTQIGSDSPVGEDVYFWHQVKAAGFRIFVDCDLKVGHLKTSLITEESYWTYKNESGITAIPKGAKS